MKYAKMKFKNLNRPGVALLVDNAGLSSSSRATCKMCSPSFNIVSRGKKKEICNTDSKYITAIFQNIDF